MTTSSSAIRSSTRNVAALVDEVGPPRVAVLVANRLQLVDDDPDDQLVARENRAQAVDRLHQLGQLVENLLPLEAGEALELHVEDGLRLDRA